MGLGEVYAEEFVNKALNAAPAVQAKKLTEDHEALIGLFDIVSRELNALSHFHFTPMPIEKEDELSIKPVAAQAALQLEDVLPTSESLGTQYAPEELMEKLKGKRASLMSKEEQTRDDKRRLRRAAKSSSKTRKDREEATTGKRSRDGDKQVYEDLKRDKRVTMHDESSGGMGGEGQEGSYSKSTTFFSNMQRQVSNEVGNTAKAIASEKSKGKGSKTDKASANSKRVML